MATYGEKKSFLDSFSFHDRASCAKAIKSGGIAALISAGITVAFGVAGFVTTSTNKDLAYMLDPAVLVDAAIFAVLAIFVFRKSRVAATLLFIYFTIGKLLMWYEMGKASGVLLTIVFFLFYLTAMRATYAWHSRYRDAEEEVTAEQAAAAGLKI
ncbi:hypothetical protein ACS5PN_15895 [Roseateles sp. NT4]|uniref:hypothetical protein n=1 Tax=Roseateles sp. NT4 TaxID=3453715 RepID=UPI003EE8BE95